MSSNENSSLEYESGVTPYPMAVLVDSGDQLKFTSSAVSFSESSGNSPVIRPNGLLTGGIVIPGVSTSDNKVDMASLTLNLNGVITSVVAVADTTVARAATDVASVSSITITSGGALAVVQGVDSADTTIVETRGAAGGPPLIPVDSVEVAQVRTTGNTAAPFTNDELFQTVGTHMEKADFPTFSIDNFTGELNFDSSLPLIHTGVVPKAVFASYADPVYTEQSFSNDFIPSENSHSVSSEQVYGATVGTSSSSLGQGSFTAILSNGITDPLVSKKNETLFFRYKQDKSKSAHILTQGKLGLARTFNASDNPKVSCTISSSVESVEKV